MYIIYALIVLFLIAGVFWAMWKLSNLLLLPIQIILFAILVFLVFKVFFTKENAEILHKELEKSGVVQVEKRAISGGGDALTQRVIKTPSVRTEKETKRVMQRQHRQEILEPQKNTLLQGNADSVQVNPRAIRQQKTLQQNSANSVPVPPQTLRQQQTLQQDNADAAPVNRPQKQQQSKKSDDDFFKMDTDSIFN